MSEIIVIPSETAEVAVDVLDPTVSITVSMAAVGIGGGSGGGVSSVSAVGQQGVSASVTSPTTTPSITIGLGAITPSSVAATGTVTGSNLSGSNTGDQVLTAGTLSGRGSTAGTGIAQTITLGTNLSMAGNVLNASGGGGNVPAGGSAGQFLQTDGTTPSWQYVQTVRLYVKNSSGATIAKGSVVYVSSADGVNPIISKALATTDSSSSKTIGIVETDIVNNGNGYVVCEGIVDGMDTFGIVDGSSLWLSATTAGAYTTAKTTAPNHLVFVGYSIKQSAGNGRIFVKPQNGYELDELHDVLITSPANNEVLTYESASGLWKNKTNPQGTVTSVAGTSPVVSSGGATPTISLASSYGDTQNPYASKSANAVLAAPNGTAGVPSFRALVAADIPTLNQNTTGTASNVTGTVAVANGGTGQTSYTDGQILIGNSTGNTLSKATLTAGSNVTITNGPGTITIAATAGGAGVSSVTATSPVASSGGSNPDISLATAYGDTKNPYASKTAGYVLAAPSGSAGTPSFRALVATDVPTLNQNTTGTASNVTGTVAVANGGTGQTTANAALNALLPTQTGNTGYFLTTNGTNSSWAAVSGSGTVTSVGVSGGTTGLTTSGGPITTSGTITLAGTLAVANGGTGGTTQATARTGIGLGNVENTALSTWTGTTTLVTVGNITTGTWNGTAIGINRGGTNITSYTKGDMIYAYADNILAKLGGNTFTTRKILTQVGDGTTPSGPEWYTFDQILPTQTGNSGKFLTTDGSTASWGTPSGTGTVTSVAVSGGTTGLTTSGGPITTSGTITIAGTLAVANGGTGATTLTGYVKGSGTTAMTASATIPGSDISGNITGNASNVTGTVAVANGGTGQTSYTDGQILIGNSTGNTLAKTTLTAGSNVTIANGPGTITISAAGGVSSVSATSPVASSGGSTPTISLSAGYGDTLNPYASKTAGYILAAPSGAAGVPTFRAIATADISTALSTWTGSSSITTVGTIATGTWNGTAIGVSKGGTAITSYTLGDLIYGSGSTSLAKLAGNSTSTKQFLTSTGTGAVANAPAWSTIAQSDVFSGLTDTAYMRATSTSSIGAGTLYRDSTSLDNRVAYLPSSTTSGAAIGGTVYQTITEVGTDASTAEKVALSVTNPYFPYTEYWVKVSGYFKFAANGNSKTIKFRISKSGGGSPFDVATVTSSASGSVVYIEAIISRDSTSWNTVGIVRSTTGSIETVLDKTTLAPTGGWSTVNDTISIILQTGTAAANNVIMRQALIEWGPQGG